MDKTDFISYDMPWILKSVTGATYACDTAEEADRIAQSIAVGNLRPSSFDDLMQIVLVYRTAVSYTKQDFTADPPDIESFKQRVAQVARRYGKQHGWCGVVNECLEELDINSFTPQIRATVTVSYQVALDVDYDSLADVDMEDTEMYVRRCLEVYNLGLRRSALSFTDSNREDAGAPQNIVVSARLLQTKEELDAWVHDTLEIPTVAF